MCFSYQLVRVVCALIQTSGCRLALDFVGRSESLDDDLRTIVQEINNRRAPDLDPYPEPRRAPKKNTAAACRWDSNTTWFYTKKVMRKYMLFPTTCYDAYGDYYRLHPQCEVQISHFYQSDVQLLMNAQSVV